MQRSIPMSRTKRTLRNVALVLGCLLVVIALSFAFYVGDYSHATPQARNALASDSAVTVTQTKDAIAFLPAQGTDTGLVFYPGGKVESESYAPLLRALAQRGFLCVVVRMPLHLAMFDTNAADRIRAEYPGIAHWYVGGHSLGGVFAAQYARKHADALSGLIFFASYPSSDLSALPLRVLSIGATNDGLSTPEKIEAKKALLPPDAQYAVILGGNHAGFGDYGPQRGDGTAAIKPAEQQKQIVDAAAGFMAR